MANDDSDSATWPLLRVAGVPEHFNFCWTLAASYGLFARHHVRVDWSDVASGTGALLASLKEGEHDLVLALTEGTVADIALGSQLRIVGTAVQSALRWGVFAGARSLKNNVDELRGATIAVSRLRSGSHLMACVLASQRGWRQNELVFSVTGAIEKLREAVNGGEADAFLWEAQMCKRDVDEGRLKQIGEIVTPWPCFLLVSTSAVVDSKQLAIERALAAVREAIAMFATDADAAQKLADRFGFELEDSRRWLQGARVTCASAVDESAIETALAALQEAGIVSESAAAACRPLAMIEPRLCALNSDIRTMRLYSRPELLRVLRQNLQALQLQHGPCEFTQLQPHTLNCYEPEEALASLARLARSGSKAIHIGSSVGGLARFVAGAHGMPTIAIEIQAELNQAASELTQRAEKSLKAPVTHVCADAVEFLPMLASASFELIFSFLTVLHFELPARLSVFQQTARLLTPSGKVLIADWFAKSELNDEERHVLSRQVFCRYLPSRAQYVQQLEQCGLQLDSIEDVSERWTAWVSTRLMRWTQEREQRVQLHGEDLYERLLSFYSTTQKLMKGNIGGLIIVCSRTSASV